MQQQQQQGLVCSSRWCGVLSDCVPLATRYSASDTLIRVTQIAKALAASLAAEVCMAGLLLQPVSSKRAVSEQRVKSRV